mgnify:CR=1 FL=1
MMKQTFLALLSLLFITASFGQDMKKVRNFYDKKDWAKGKEAIDLVLANEKEQKNWEAWYYKGLIYGQVAKDANLSSTVPDAWMVSFESYLKAMELDSKQAETFMTLRNFPVFDNYLELQRQGNDLFNKQDYKTAFERYKQADKVGRFIFKNKWALSEVDTILYYYMGAAAMQSDNMEGAVEYFKKICDANIGGEGFDVCYRYVSYYFDKKGDVETADKYAAMGRKLYPEDSYYDRVELDRERKKNGIGPALFEKYDVVLQRDTKDYDLRYDYAAEVFNWMYNDGEAPADQKEKYFNKIVEQLKICTEIDPAKIDGYLLLGKTYFNDAAFLQEDLKKIRGKTPEDEKKKADMKAKMETRMKEALPFLERSHEMFKKVKEEEFKAEKRLRNEYKTTLYLLTEAHRFLGNTEKEKFYDKEYQKLNQ